MPWGGTGGSRAAGRGAFPGVVLILFALRGEPWGGGWERQETVVSMLEGGRTSAAASYLSKPAMSVLFFLFQILGAVILGFGIWILADKTSFIAVLRKTVFPQPLPRSE